MSLSLSLPPVLCSTELPWPELQAARLDGEVYSIGLGVSPIDVVEAPVHRAAALRPILGGRLIAERRTAAWIWGALLESPVTHELCVDIDERTTRPVGAAVVVREIVVESDDWVMIAGVRVATPLRTVSDIARTTAEWTAADGQLVERLARLGGVTTADCIAVFGRGRNLPYKRRALERIRAALGGVSPS